MAIIQGYLPLLSLLESEETRNLFVDLLTKRVEFADLITEICVNIRSRNIPVSSRNLKAFSKYFGIARKFTKKHNNKGAVKKVKLLSSPEGRRFLLVLLRVFVEWQQSSTS